MERSHTPLDSFFQNICSVSQTVLSCLFCYDDSDANTFKPKYVVNPVSNVLGGWTLYNEEGELTTEAIENVMLMLPFIVLLLWTFRDRLLDKVSLGSIVWVGVKFSFLFSVSIEFLQLFLRLGTFQLSDIFYNTLGGLDRVLV